MTKENLEHIPDYYYTYLDLVAEKDYFKALENTTVEFEEFVESFPISKENYRYGEEKWSSKQVLLHIIDTERIFQYRVLCFIRDERRGLPGYDQNHYAQNSVPETRTMGSILEEFKVVRASTKVLFKNIDKELLLVKKMANGFSVQPLLYGYLLSGHLRHHINILKDKYF